MWYILPPLLFGIVPLFLLLCLPFGKGPLALVTFKIALHIWKQTAGKGFYFMLGDICVRLLFCHISPFLFSCQGTIPHGGGENFCLYLSPFLYCVPLLPFHLRQHFRRDTVNEIAEIV